MLIVHQSSTVNHNIIIIIVSATMPRQQSMNAKHVCTQVGVAQLASIGASVAGVVDLRLRFGVGCVLQMVHGGVSGGRGRRSDVE